MARGYHATGLNQIVQGSMAPKGSLYFHFPGGKEEIVSAAIQLAGEWTCARVKEILDKEGTVADAMAEVAMHFAHMQKESYFAHGCALASVGQELTGSDKRLLKAVKEGFVAWRQLFVNRFIQAGFAAEDAENWADFSLSTIEGAQMLSKAQRDTRPLVASAKLLHQLIDKAEADHQRAGQ